MGDLDYRNPAVHAPIIASCGSTVDYTVNKRFFAPASSFVNENDDEEDLTIPKNAVVQLKVPKSKKQQEQVGLLRLAEAVFQKNRLYKQKYNL